MDFNFHLSMKPFFAITTDNQDPTVIFNLKNWLTCQLCRNLNFLFLKHNVLL